MKNYFSIEEQSCNCGCDGSVHNQVLLDMLNKARYRADIPFIVSSWYRCKDHNANVGGSATSGHLQGKAVDIKYKNSVDLFKIVSSLVHAGFTRIGINYNKKFVHCDVSVDKLSPVLFTY